MELTYECPNCESVGRLPDVEEATEAVCPACGHARAIHVEAFSGGELVSCAWCATEDLYSQKDFPHILGLAIVVAGFAVSTVFWYFYLPILAFAALLATAALDVVLFYLVPDVTICYRCLCQYRGPGSNPGRKFPAFDLAIGERYRQERLRVEELRQQRASGSKAGD
ncbi:MAG: hypothetical protein IRY99_08100 [Isosphaeraceae bacterium]|nr:hypothetical protein [Isosphaeraceae bacterium]